jgi:DNA-binding NtrC family response regulator
MLKREKFEVVEALCAEEALDMLENQEVDLVISDLKMNGMSGIDFLSELREWDMNIPVIFVSGWGKEKDWQEALRSKASALIEKPFSKDAILKAIQKALQDKESLCT